MAATAPDHGLLRPWRLVVIRGEARGALGAAFARAGGTESAADKPLRAPLLLSIVFCPRRGHKVTEWEQLAATSAMIQNLGLLLHIKGWGSIWRTGSFVDAEPVLTLLRIDPAEQLLGWLYIGTPESAPRPPRQPFPDVRALVTCLDGGGIPG
jgi:nitroreductase